MADELIPADVRDFILRHIDSVAQIEALLLLRGSTEEAWNLQNIAKRLYTSEQELTDVLMRLCEDGLLSLSGDTYRHDCATPELRDVVDRLATVYSRQLIAVTNMIHAKPRRIREFADAFKIRRDR